MNARLNARGSGGHLRSAAVLSLAAAMKPVSKSAGRVGRVRQQVAAQNLASSAKLAASDLGARPFGAQRKWIVSHDLTWASKLASAKGPVLDHALPLLGRTANYSRLWLGTSAALAATGDRASRRGAIRGLIGIGLASPVTNVLAKRYAQRARPLADSVPIIRRLRHAPITTSFPSGHSASAAAFATGVVLENPLAGAPVAVLAGGVALSRVVTAAHFPSDVIAGCTVGVGLGLTTLALWPRAAKHGPADAAAAVGAPASPTGEGVEIVVNSGAGTTSDTLAEYLRSALPDAVITECDGDGFDDAITTAAGRCTVLGIAGGDGSISTAAEHALEKRLPLLVIPAGTLNHFARDLGVTSAEDAVEAVRQGSAVEIDVATIGGEIFLNTCSAGVYTDLVLARQQFEAGVGKWPAMVLGLGRVLIHGKPQDLLLDGVPRRLWVFFAGNGQYGPKGAVPAYRRNLSDGLIDIRLLDADKSLSRLRLIFAAVAGTLARSRVYEESAVRSIRVESDGGGEPTQFTLDGEPGLQTASATVRKAADPLIVYRPSTV